MIRNTVGKKNYVGVTSSIGSRWAWHIEAGTKGHNKKNGKNTNKMYSDMKKLGVEKFVFKILETISCDFENEAYDAEEKWIRKLNSVNSGYNRAYHQYENFPPSKSKCDPDKYEDMTKKDKKERSM